MAAGKKQTTGKKDFPTRKPGPGRPKGVPNRTTTLLKDAILLAAEQAGGKGGLVAYLKLQAIEQPGPFMALLGKVMPTQLTGEDGGAVKIETTGASDFDVARRVLFLLAKADQEKDK